MKDNTQSNHLSTAKACNATAIKFTSMNLPENLSPAAARVYELLAANPSGQSADQLAAAFNNQPTAEGSPKAIATVDSLLVKEIIRKEGKDDEATYTLVKPAAAENPDTVYAGDGYVEGEGDTQSNSANAEEQRMIELLQKNDGKLPEAQLFEQYDKEQQPAAVSEPKPDNSEIDVALKELTEAGVITKEGDNYRIKK